MSTVPEELRLAKDGATLTVVFAGRLYPLSAEYLRVHSPSAEVRGHGNTPNLVAGKKSVIIRGVEPVGNYAVRLIFSDGHNSGIYSWETFYELARNKSHYWRQYLHALQETGKTRESI